MKYSAPELTLVGDARGVVLGGTDSRRVDDSWVGKAPTIASPYTTRPILKP